MIREKSTIKVGIADLNFVESPDTIRTSGLGSCVGVIIYDVSKQMAGLAHIMLPDSNLSKQKNLNIYKYADTAIDYLYEQLLSQGASKYQLKAKVAGGAQMFPNQLTSEVMRIGPRNVEAITEQLKKYRIPIVASDVGGSSGRTIDFDPATSNLTIRTVNEGEKIIYPLDGVEQKGGTIYMDNSQYEKTLWKRWKNEKGEEIANELIQYYLHVVDYHVETIAQHIPQSFDKVELKSLGIMGLYDALHKYDSERNVKFTTYASIRVHGSIMDGLRKEDWLPRTLREKANKIEKTSAVLEQKLNRIPTSTDIAEELNMEVGEVEEAVSDTLFAKVQSLDASYQNKESDSASTTLAYIYDNNTKTPSEHLLANDLREELIEHIKQLGKNEQ